MTFRDMSPVVRAAGMQGYEALMQELGILPSPLLQRNDIDPNVLADPEAFVSLHSIIRLLEESANAARCPDLGLRLAGYHEPGILGVVALVIQNAPTVEQAIADTSRYLCLHSPAFEITFENRSSRFEDCVTLRFEIRLSAFIAQRQTVDACIGHMFQSLRLFYGDRFSLRGVSLPHSPVAPKRAYRNFFHAPVFFEEAYAGLHLHRDLLQANMKSVNPMVRQLALEHIAQRMPPRALGLSDRVRQTLAHTLGANRGTKSEIAELLGVHPRTLQRRLDQEGMTFEAIREEVYKSATLRLLRETRVPLKQLAGALGFSEQSALTRSCRRWFGNSPSQIRSGAKQP